VVEGKNIAEPVQVYTVLPASGQHRGIQTESPEETDQSSIIVLPFNNMSGDQEQNLKTDLKTSRPTVRRTVFQIKSEWLRENNFIIDKTG